MQYRFHEGSRRDMAVPGENRRSRDRVKRVAGILRGLHGPLIRLPHRLRKTRLSLLSCDHNRLGSDHLPNTPVQRC